MSELLIKESAQARIVRKTGRKPCECKCSKCKSQCHTPCLGTPEDIKRLIEAGYSDRLKITFWAVGMIMGVSSSPIPMVQATVGENGFCAFFQDGLCELHDKKLKPTEGRLSHHTITAENFKVSKSLSWNVAKEWTMEENFDTIKWVLGEFARREIEEFNI